MMASLEFTDCPSCRKRVRTTATLCHHCKKSLTPNVFDDESEAESEAHYAASMGGYSLEDDDFDYEEFIEKELPDHGRGGGFRNRWKYVFIMLLFVFGILFLAQLFVMW